MAFNVSSFISSLNGDGARPNLFDVSIPTFGNKLGFTCKTAQLPGSTIGMAPVYYFGREVKFAGNRTFADWTVNILNDEDFTVRNALEGWMASINSHQNNQAEYLFDTYSFDAYVNQYAKTGEVIKTYTFHGMFPIDIAPIDLDWGSNDTIEEYAVTFAYQWWDSDSAV